MLIEQHGSPAQIPMCMFLALGLSKITKTRQPPSDHSTRQIYPYTYLELRLQLLQLLDVDVGCLCTTHITFISLLQPLPFAHTKQPTNLSTHSHLLILSRSTPFPGPIVVDTALNLSSFINFGQLLFRTCASTCSESRSRVGALAILYSAVVDRAAAAYKCAYLCSIWCSRVVDFVCRPGSQPSVRTIEGVLFDALMRAGAVSKDNADNPTKVLTHPLPLVVPCLQSAGQSWTGGMYGRGRPRRRQRRVHETDPQHSRRQRLGLSY